MFPGKNLQSAVILYRTNETIEHFFFYYQGKYYGKKPKTTTIENIGRCVCVREREREREN